MTEEGIMLRRTIEKLISEDEESRSQAGMRISVIGIFSNIILFLVKILAGVSAGSISITADAVNNLTDSASAGLTLVGFYYANKPPDKEHPYGHERSEYISAMFVSLLIIIVGYQFLMTSINRIMNPQSTVINPLVLAILILSIVVKIIQGRFYLLTSKKLNSSAIYATAQDSFNDVYSTAAVLISAVIEYLTDWHIDGIIAFFIALFILYSGITLVINAMNELLGKRPDDSTVNDITKVLNEYAAEVIGYHDLLVHDYGPNKTFATIHVEVDDTWSLTEAHQLINNIEEQVLEKLGIHLVCHIDPIAVQNRKATELYRKVKSILKSFNLELKFHDFQVEETETEIILHFDVVLPDNVSISTEALNQAIQQKVKDQIGLYKTNITYDKVYLLK